MAVSVKDLDCHAIIFISYGYFSFPRSAYEIRHALARAESHATTLFWIVRSDLSESPWRNCEQANIYFNQCTLTNFARLKNTSHNGTTPMDGYPNFPFFVSHLK